MQRDAFSCNVAKSIILTQGATDRQMELGFERVYWEVPPAISFPCDL